MIVNTISSESRNIAVELADETTNIVRGLDCNLPMHLEETICNVPAAALAPQVIGEPVRGDIVWPLSPRGLGGEWPQQSVVSSNNDPGRIPAAYAWQMLLQQSDWRWRSPAEITIPVSGAEAIMSMVQHAAYKAGIHMMRQPEKNRSTIILPVANTLAERHQQELIDNAQRNGIDVQLLWRPIAAALAWCDDYREQLLEMNPTKNNKVGTVVVGYFGLDEFEYTALEIISRKHDGQWYFLPGRGRPDRSKDVIGSFGFKVFHQLAAEVLRKNNIPPTTGNIWRLTWCSSWLQDTLKKLASSNDVVPEDQTLPSDVPSLSVREVKEVWHEITSNLNANGVDNAEVVNRSLIFNSFEVNAFTEWISAKKSELATEGSSLLAGIAIGPLACVRKNTGITMGESFLSKMSKNFQQISVAGIGLPKTAVARGAAIYGKRLKEGLPTYLDTLPQIQIAIQSTQSGKTEWSDLLTDGDTYVDGGRRWRRDPDITGLAIQANSSNLELFINHEEHNHVRTVSAAVPKKLNQNEAVSLSVTITPAQGSATIEVVPEDRAIFAGRRVLVEWRNMPKHLINQEPVNAEEFLKSLPRSYPDISPRVQYHEQWSYVVCRAIRSFLDQAETYTVAQQIRKIIKIKEHLLKRDPAQYQVLPPRIPREASAIDSEGLVPTGQHWVGEFVGHLKQLLISTRVTKIQKGDIVRTIAYTSTDDEEFMELVIKAIIGRDPCGVQKETQHVLAACGWCLRKPKHAEIFAKKLLTRIENVHNSGSNNWWKAFAEMLRYRSDITREISPELAESITDKAIDQFERERMKRKGNYLFRYTALSVVYLLRLRAFHPNYLDPMSPIAIKAKKSFQQAIDDAEKGKLEVAEGSIAINAALESMIEHIDRRGSGNIPLQVRG